MNKETPEIQNLINLFNAQSETLQAYKLYHLLLNKLVLLEQKIETLVQRTANKTPSEKEELN